MKSERISPFWVGGYRPFSALMKKNDNNILIYQDDNGITKVNVRFSDEDVWLTQAQLAEIYGTTQENISMHIKNIYKDAELQ